MVWLSRAWCKWFAYGPADATAIQSSLASLESRMVCLSGTCLPRLSWKVAHYNSCFLENTATGLMANYSIFAWQSLPFSCEARLVLMVSETASVCMLLALCWLEVFYIIALYKSEFAYLFADDCRMSMSEVPNVVMREWWRESQCFVKRLPTTKMTGLSLPFMWW